MAARPIQNEVEVEQSGFAGRGLLTQTLVGGFENADLAAAARDYLNDHLGSRPRDEQILAAGDGLAASKAEAQKLMPHEHWKDAVGALDDGRALLVGHRRQDRRLPGARTTGRGNP